MNDDFLKAFQRQPREEFAFSLYKRLSRFQGGTERFKRPSFTLRTLAIGSVALILVLAGLLTTSPSVRAAIAEILRDIGGMTFVETSQYPGGNGPVETVPVEWMTLEEAQARLPHPIQLPAWLPEGSVRRDLVEVSTWPNNVTMVQIFWEIIDQEENGPAFPTFHLLIHTYTGKNDGWIVGQDALEEVSINGQPAALFRGGWDADLQEWNPNIPNITLSWTNGEIVYTLNWPPAEISTDDMFQVAESIP